MIATSHQVLNDRKVIEIENNIWLFNNAFAYLYYKYIDRMRAEYMITFRLGNDGFRFNNEETSKYKIWLKVLFLLISLLVT